MRQKCVWILNHYAKSPDLPGGTRHHDIARHLVSDGYRVAIFASSFMHDHFVDAKLEKSQRWKVETVGGVDFVWIKTFPYFRNNWRRYLNMISYMTRCILVGCRRGAVTRRLGRPEVVVGSSVHLLAVVSGWVLARTYGARFVMEARDLWPQTLVDAGEMPPHHPVVLALSILERLLYRHADHIVIVPPLASEYIESRGVPKEKITWIPNGVDLSSYPAVTPRSPNGGDFVVMYAGTFGRTNGVQVILEAATLLRQAEVGGVAFRLVGDGPERRRLEAVKAERGLDNVEISGPVPKREVAGLLAGADALVHCEVEFPNLSRYGSSPNKFCDYLASGRPLIVASDFIKDRVEEAGFGVRVPPDDPAALAAAIQDLMRLPAVDRERMGRRAREHVEATYSMQVIVSRLKASVFLDGPGGTGERAEDLSCGRKQAAVHQAGAGDAGAGC